MAIPFLRGKEKRAKSPSSGQARKAEDRINGVPIEERATRETVDEFIAIIKQRGKSTVSLETPQEIQAYTDRMLEHRESDIRKAIDRLKNSPVTTSPPVSSPLSESSVTLIHTGP